MSRPRSAPEALRPLAGFAESLASAIDAWGQGRSYPEPAAPLLSEAALRGAGLPAVELSRLARSMERLAGWPGRASNLASRVVPPVEPAKREIAALLGQACRSLASGLARLPSDADGAARAAAEAQSVSNAVERKRNDAARAAAEAPPLDSLKLRSVLEAYAWASDAVERAAIDLASAAAACGSRERP